MRKGLTELGRGVLRWRGGEDLNKGGCGRDACRIKAQRESKRVGEVGEKF